MFLNKLTKGCSNFEKTRYNICNACYDQYIVYAFDKKAVTNPWKGRISSDIIEQTGKRRGIHTTLFGRGYADPGERREEQV